MRSEVKGQRSNGGIGNLRVFDAYRSTAEKNMKFHCLTSDL